MRLAWMIATGAACLAFACANGATPALLDDDAGTGPSSYVPPNGRDAGPTTPPAPPSPTDAATPPDDPAKDAAVDSAPKPGGDDCVGTMSAQLFSSYDDACDHYWSNGGKANPCTPGGTSCAALSTFTEFCCFNSPAGSHCADHYGTPQCVPK